MFEILFKYPWTVFEKGRLVLLSGAPLWLLAALLAAGGAVLGAQVWRRFQSGRVVMSWPRVGAIWLLQTALIALLLALLWRPAVSVATLKPQQNMVAVLVDDSRSMSIREGSATRLEQAAAVLRNSLLEDLKKKFQVRLYSFGKDLRRIEALEELEGKALASRIGDNLKTIAAEAGSLPVGAVLLLSDGSDNTGGISLDTIAEIRRRRIPVHSVGIGREQFDRDIEIREAALPSRALADSRLSAVVTFRHRGYAERKARLVVRESGKALASQEVTLRGGDAQQTEAILFNAGIAGPKSLEVSIEPLEGEENRGNNALTRLVHVEARKARILYLEGEPRWEMKFIRRAAEEDRSLLLASILRTTENKTYRQGIANPKELEEGFPARPEELFGFQGLIVGSVEAAYFTPAQQELIRQFVDQRGGGVLFLAGRSALADGGYARSALAELLPVTLPERKGTFAREEAGVELTAAGRASILCRLEERTQNNAERWKKLPALADHQDAGAPKPGAVVLAELTAAGGRRMPLLTVQNYGRGRTAVLATGGTWRWQMLQDHTDQSHEMFWRQLLRWLVSEVPGQVSGSTPRGVLSDETGVALRAEIKDRSFRSVADARVEARILGPGGSAEVVELNPAAEEPGRYAAAWAAERPGSYLAEIMAKRGEEEVGRDVLMFLREDGVAENFGVEQNRELLTKLAEQTGGRYWRPEQARRLAEEISYSEAGVSVRETRELWNMPAVFLLILALRAAEWLLRRKWGAV
jgi:hypothetical protein